MYRAVILFLLYVFPLFCSLAGNVYFFDEDDVAAIRKNAGTPHGEKILSGLKRVVTDRLGHSLYVPLLEGGHAHDYFCPVHDIPFSFDWTKPASHYCSQCGRYWENEKRYDWAWVNEVHDRNLSFMKACMYLYMATGEQAYGNYIKDMLLDYASKYPTYLVHNRERKYTESYSGKMFAQSLDEAVWASEATRAYAVAKPLMNKEEIRKIENGYLKECAAMLLNRKAKGNWQVWHNSGLIALGVALDNDSIIDVALNDPQYGYHYQLESQVYEDGWWNEGSPTYHFYPLRAMILSAEALRCKGINLYDEKFYNMFASPALGVYADLSFPSHNDGWYGESLVAYANLYEIVGMRFKNNDLFYDILSQCYTLTGRTSPESLQNNREITAYSARQNKPGVCFKNSGFAILRSGQKCVVLKYGPHGGLHGHPDKLSISIHDGKKEIVSDLGTPAYGVPSCANWYRNTLSHSTMTIDGKNQSPVTGKLLQFTSTSKGGTVKAESDDAYPGISMSRELTFSGSKLKDVYTCRSAEKHVYDYVLILTEQPSFTEKGESAALSDTEVYKQIKDQIKITPGKQISFKVGQSQVKIESVSGLPIEVYTGTAPGTPVAGSNRKQMHPCYPLIVRVKGDHVTLKTEWNIN